MGVFLVNITGEMINKIKTYYNWGGRFLTNKHLINGEKTTKTEISKQPLRTDVINYIISTFKRDVIYLEIGVRNPNHNFNKINTTSKYSVDPGVEFKENPVDFKLTSDNFFSKLENGEILSQELRFDVIFIDGLHLANQVERDIENALKFVSEDGFIILHDCNPPSEWHARECYDYDLTPAKQYWNGTTWKAFVNARKRDDIYSCCIDTDWGIGVISKTIDLGKKNTIINNYFEYHIFEEYRFECLNLIEFDKFTKIVN